MESEQLQMILPVSTSTQDNVDLRLQGRWLMLSRISWVILATWILVVFWVGLPTYVAQAHLVCMSHSCNPGQLTLQTLRLLEEAHISLQGYVTINTLLVIAAALVWFVCGMGIYWLKSNDWIAWLVTLQMLTQGANGVISVLEASHSFWHLPALALDSLNSFLLFFAFALFPSGRFSPRWIRWLAMVWVGYTLFPFLMGVLPPGLSSALNSMGGVIWFGFMGCLVFSQFYRYRRTSSAIQRQQTKWLVSAFTLIMLLEFALTIPTLLQPALAQPDHLYSLVVSNVTMLVLLLGPLGISVAILRYRLWDIQIIINRALVYGSLTFLLVLIYLASIFVVQFLFHTFAGPAASSNIALVISTLVSASLFQPLRRRIQTIIDRRFYRRKYNAERILAAFGETLRSELELGQLCTHLVEIVEETIQPRQVSLWLLSRQRRAEREPLETSTGLEEMRL